MTEISSFFLFTEISLICINSENVKNNVYKLQEPSTIILKSNMSEIYIMAQCAGIVKTAASAMPYSIGSLATWKKPYQKITLAQFGRLYILSSFW